MSVITCSSCGNYDLLPLRRYSHACLQIVLLRSFTSLLLSTRRSCVNGCLLAIIQSSLPLWSFEHSGPITLCACLDALMSSCHTHRYRRPRLLTQLKRGAKFENPRWRLNRSKIIDSAYEKRCFCILRSPILFPIPMNHLFVGRTNWCERFGCIFVLISTIYNLKFKI
jgi:hypothetical protein